MGVSALSFAANIAVKQNAMVYEKFHARAALAVHKSFYVDDELTDASSESKIISLLAELQELFEKAGILLEKWKSNCYVYTGRTVN